MVIDRLSKSLANALGKNASRRGLTVEAYLKQLLAEDIELERVARTKTFAQLTIPFQNALARPQLAKSRTNSNKISRGKTNPGKMNGEKLK
jgi:hypothetical protein